MIQHGRIIADTAAFGRINAMSSTPMSCQIMSCLKQCTHNLNRARFSAWDRLLWAAIIKLLGCIANAGDDTLKIREKELENFTHQTCHVDNRPPPRFTLRIICIQVIYGSHKSLVGIDPKENPIESRWASNLRSVLLLGGSDVPCEAVRLCRHGWIPNWLLTIECYVVHPFYPEHIYSSLAWPTSSFILMEFSRWVFCSSNCSSFWQ